MLGRFIVGTLSLLCLSSSTLQSTQSCDENNLSPNRDYRIRYIVIDYTALGLEESLRVFQSPESNISVHYLIPENPVTVKKTHRITAYRLVPDSQSAWHAGVCSWKGQTTINDNSLGIALVNLTQYYETQGKRFFYYRDFTPNQLATLISILEKLTLKYPNINPTCIVGHSDIAPGRKNDPGPRFPWELLYQHGFGAWFDYETMCKYLHIFATTPPQISVVQALLKQYGYNIQVTGVEDNQTRVVLKAFQEHFVQERVTGNPDLKTCAILFALVEKYYTLRFSSIVGSSISDVESTITEPASTVKASKIPTITEGSTSNAPSFAGTVELSP